MAFTTVQISPSKHPRKSKNLIKNSNPLPKYTSESPATSEPVLNSLQVEEQQAFRHIVKLKEATILPSSFPTRGERPNHSGSPSRGFIEAWLRETSERQRDTSTPSRKRKRKRSRSSTPASEAFLQSREVLKDPEERTFTMNTPQKDKKGSTSNVTPTSKQTPGTSRKKDHDWVKDRLSTFRMFQDDEEAFARYPDFRNKVLDILGGERLSEAKAASVKLFQSMRKEYEGANEDTLLDALIPCLIKADRTVEPHSSTGGLGPEPNDTGVASHLNDREQIPEDGVKGFFEDGIVRMRNTNFQGTFLPINDDQVIKQMAKVDHMTNPRPDYIFGLSRRMYDPLPGKSPTHDSKELMRTIVPGMYDPILLIEGKSNKGSLVDAQNQVCRGGAALVNAARKLHESIGEKDVEGADHRTFVFSSTIDPKIMEIWVHWAEVTRINRFKWVDKAGPDGETMKVQEPYSEKRVVWHMNFLKSGLLRAESFVGEFRGYFHNILDWRCGGRYYNESKPFYKKLYAFEELQEANCLAGGTSEAGSRKSQKSQSRKSVAFEAVDDDDGDNDEYEETPMRKGKSKAPIAAPNTRRKVTPPAPATAESDGEIPAANTRSRKPRQGRGK